MIMSPEKLAALSPEKLADYRIKHLEMVAAQIVRMAGYSAACKGYCLTLTTAICGLAIAAKSAAVLYVAITPVLLFALIDARYLAIERDYRALYERVRSRSWDEAPNFALTPGRAEWTLVALMSWSVGFFYLSIVLTVVVVELLRGWLNVSIR